MEVNTRMIPVEKKPEKPKQSEVMQLEPPRSLAIARNGITTSSQFAELMSSLMSDIIENRVTPAVANATVNAGGKLLKMVELEYKYGTAQPGANKKSIELLR